MKSDTWYQEDEARESVTLGRGGAEVEIKRSEAETTIGILAELCGMPKYEDISLVMTAVAHGYELRRELDADGLRHWWLVTPGGTQWNGGLADLPRLHGSLMAELHAVAVRSKW